MIEQGFYIIKDEFYEDFPDKYLKGNKEENRPHCFAIPDEKNGIYWMIPMSSKIEKYRKIIQKREALGKPCDTLHIAKLDDGRESAFLIQDIFPITEKYIKKKYTIGTNHLRITSEHLAQTIIKKSRKTLSLIHRGIKFTPTQANVLKIKRELIK